MASLEAQLGAPLFERTGRGVAPTTLALAIADDARAMQLGAEQLQQRLARQRTRTSGTVRITTSQVAASYLLPPVLAALQAAEPGIEVELVASNQLTNLLRREADIAVRMVRPAQASLVAKKLADIAITTCAHGSYLARAGALLRPDELLRHRLVGYDRDDTLLRGFAAMGFPIGRENFALRTDDQLAYGRFVATGGGHWLPGCVQPALAAGVGAGAADAEDPAAALLAGGAPRDPRQRARAPRLRLPRRGNTARTGGAGGCARDVVCGGDHVSASPQ